MFITEYDQARAFAEQRGEGRAEGIAEGIEIGVARGKAEGKAEGKEEGALSMLTGLVEDGILSVLDAAKRAGMPLPEFETKTGLKAGSATS